MSTLCARSYRWFGPTGPGRCLLLFAFFLSLPLLTLFPADPVRAASGQCPDLSGFYADGEPDWAAMERQLRPLMQRCLRSSEYFALLGAAQLNTANLGPAMESLERALLLDPDNGAARVDYAQVLFLQGQLFPALQLNRQLLAREDLPASLEPGLRRRQQEWRALTVEQGIRGEVLVGHDSNLNRGPGAREITLTLAGEPVTLLLGEDFRPVRGEYSSLRLTGQRTLHRPDHSHNWLVELGGRVSEDSRSDISRFSTRYARVQSGRRHNWQVGGAVTHLLVGGESLFSALEAGLRWESEGEQSCQPYTGLTGQQQFYHQGGSPLDALEVRLTGGLGCSAGGSALSWEVSGLGSHATNDLRPGGDRLGWQTVLDWRHRLGGGVLGWQISHTRIRDGEGYSELLDNDARRDLTRNHVAIEYRHPLTEKGQLLINLYHQNQQSNLELFTSRDTAIEAGLRFDF